MAECQNSLDSYDTNDKCVTRRRYFSRSSLQTTTALEYADRLKAVVLLAIFSIALCWYFFSDYTCCPCRKKRPQTSLLPTTLSVQQQSTTAQVSAPAAPSAPLAIPQPYFRPPQPYLCPPKLYVHPPQPFVRPLVVLSPESRKLSPSAPPAVPQPPDSPVVRLTLGSKKLSDIVFEENGVPNLDLHGMTVLEARSATQGFLERQRIIGSSPIQIITGKGLHSNDGVAKIKPAIKNILLGEDLNFVESSQGGAYLVYL